MRCPSLSELPSPPPTRTGWPWTEASNSLPDTRAEGFPWLRVTVVTPSYNQAQFLEETIRSVLLQGYPNLEYIIMDGGSTDGSVEIIQKYAPWLTYWVSEKDGGQADAVNKGWRMATGEALTWLNSDDTLGPDSLNRAANALYADPGALLVFGDVKHIDTASQQIGYRAGRAFSLDYVLLNWHNITPQPGFLMRSEALERIGFLDTNLHFAMDFDYWLRLAIAGGGLTYLPWALANARLHPAAKTSQNQLLAAHEQLEICRKILPLPEHLDSLKQREPQIEASCYQVAAYWAYLAGDAGVTRQYAAVALRYFGLRSRGALALWLLGSLGDSKMQLLRRLWKNRRRLPL